MFLSPMQKIVSNCRLFLDHKANNIKTLENISEDDNFIDEKIQKIQKEIPNINAFDISLILGIGLCNDGIINELSFKEHNGYHTIDQPIYKMVLNNLKLQFNLNKDIMKEIVKSRAEKKIKTLKSSIIEIDAFQMSQIIAIAFIKNPQDVFNDFVKL